MTIHARPSHCLRGSPPQHSTSFFLVDMIKDCSLTLQPADLLFCGLLILVRTCRHKSKRAARPHDAICTPPKTCKLPSNSYGV